MVVCLNHSKVNRGFLRSHVQSSLLREQTADRKQDHFHRKGGAAFYCRLRAAVMAVSRRSSQQQQQQSALQSPPRNNSISGAPMASPPMAVPTSAPVPPESERECSGGIEVAVASPDLPAPVLASSASFTTTTSSSSSGGGGGSSSVSSPGSGAASPADGSSGIGGAFRELFEACRNGDVSRVKRLVDSVNVNAKDMAGRKSTPLHFAAGNDELKLAMCGG